MNRLSGCGSYPFLVFAYIVLQRFAERHVISSVTDGVHWRWHMVINTTEAELNDCLSVDPVHAADAGKKRKNIWFGY